MSALEYVVQGSLKLKDGGILSIDDRPGTVLYVWRGAVWVTQEGEPRDRVVHAGEWFRVTLDGRTVVSALGPAEIAITEPEREPAGMLEQVRAFFAQHTGRLAAA